MPNAHRNITLSSCNFTQVFRVQAQEEASTCCPIKNDTQQDSIIFLDAIRIGNKDWLPRRTLVFHSPDSSLRFGVSLANRVKEARITAVNKSVDLTVLASVISRVDDWEIAGLG